jgi:sugar O-acyltransferase (sialic acid O-acetyltransferase NeuD family)
MKNLVIYGGSFTNLIKLIDFINRDKPTWKVVGYLDDVLFGKKREIMGYPVLGTGKDIAKYNNKNMYFTNNVGADTRSRLKVTELLEKHNVKFANLIAPNVDTNYVKIGKDVTILDGAKLGVNIEIGNHVLIRWASIITHDNKIDDHAFIGPGVTVCGYTHIGAGTYVGAGSTINEKIKIGSWCTVGSGSTVIRDVEDNDVVAGVPAKSIASRKNKNHKNNRG